LYTDHKPLEKLSTVHTKTLNCLQQAMSEHDFVICHKPGHEMPADFHSRNVSSISSFWTMTCIFCNHRTSLFLTLLNW
jgi:hypothetical protein